MQWAGVFCREQLPQTGARFHPCLWGRILFKNVSFVIQIFPVAGYRLHADFIEKTGTAYMSSLSFSNYWKCTWPESK